MLVGVDDEIVVAVARLRQRRIGEKSCFEPVGVRAIYRLARKYGHSRRQCKFSDVDKSPAFFKFCDKVDEYNDRFAENFQFADKPCRAFYRLSLGNDRDRIVIARCQKFFGYGLFVVAALDGVQPRQVCQRDLFVSDIKYPAALVHGNAVPVSDAPVSARKGVEQRGLTRVRISCKDYSPHISTVILSAYSLPTATTAPSTTTRAVLPIKNLIRVIFAPTIKPSSHRTALSSLLRSTDFITAVVCGFKADNVIIHITLVRRRKYLPTRNFICYGYRDR